MNNTDCIVKNIINSINLNSNLTNVQKEKKDNSRDMETLFWKVMHNSYLFDKIFKLIEHVNDKEIERKSSNGSIEFYKYSNRFKFKEITSLEWLIEKKQWVLLMDKISSGQYIHLEKSSLNLLFNLCEEEMVFKSIYNDMKLQLQLIDPVYLSTKNNNEIALSLFINKYELPIYQSTYEYAICNSSLKTINYLIKSMDKRNQQINQSIKDKTLVNCFKNYKCFSKSDKQIKYFLDRKDQLLSNSIDIIKVSIQQLFKLKTIECKQQIFEFGYLDLNSREISIKFISNYLLLNFKQITIMELCLVIDILTMIDMDSVVINVNEPPQLKNTLDSIRKKDQFGYFKENPLEKESVIIHLKTRLLKLCQIDELILDLLMEYGTEKIELISFIPMQIVYQYTFQSFSIEAFNHLLHTQYEFSQLPTNISKLPSLSVLENQDNIYNFIKLFTKQQRVKYYGWSEIYKFLLQNLSDSKLMDKIITIDQFSIKSLLISDIKFKRFSMFKWYLEKIVFPYGSKLHKMNYLSCYFKTIQISPNYYYREKEESQLISIENISDIDFIISNKSFFQLGSLDTFSILNKNNKKLTGGSGFFTIINSIGAAKYCCQIFQNLPKDLIFYNTIKNCISNCNIDQLKQIDKIIGLKLNYIHFNFNSSIVQTQQVYKLFSYLNNSGFKSFSKTGIYYLVTSLIESFENSNFDLLLEIICSCNVNDEKYSKCFIELFITSCFQSKNYNHLKLALQILKKLNFNQILSPQGDYSGNDLKFKFYKNLLNQNYSVDKRLDGDLTDCIISMIQLLIIGNEKYPPIEYQSDFYPLFQHLYNLLVCCNGATLENIKYVGTLYKRNSIPLKTGFYHSFFYLDIKTPKLGRYYLFIRVEGLENEVFNHSTRYNGDIIHHYLIDLELSLDYIMDNNYQDIFYFLRTIIMVAPINNSGSGNGNGSSGDSGGTNNNNSKSLSSSWGSVNSLDEYTFEDQSFCNEKEQELLYSLNQDIEYLSTFNQYDLVVRLLKDSLEATIIDSFTLKERTKSFLISAIDIKSCEKLINLGIDGLDYQLLEQSFIESRLDLIIFLLSNYPCIKSGFTKSILKSDKHYLFQLNQLDIVEFMFSNHIEKMGEFDQDWFSISFENGLIEMCCLILKYYPLEPISISKQLLIKTLENKNINIVKYFYQNYNSISLLKYDIQKQLKINFPLDYKDFDWV